MSKEIKLIDLNLMSGSTETFRTAVGGYYDIVSSSEGEQVEEVIFDPSNILSPFISSIDYNTDLKEEISDEVMTPNYKFPIRITGDPDEIKDDNFWKISLLGGEFGGIKYNSIYTDAAFDNLSCDYTLPYPKLDANVINYVASAEIISDTIQISYDYNQYVPTYERYIKNIVSEKLIPNMYLLKMYEVEDDLDTSQTIKDFVTIEQTYENPENLLGESDVVIDEDSKDHITYIDSLISSYLSSSIILTQLSSSTKEDVENMFENIIFDENVLTDVSGDDTYSQMLASKNMIPFYTKFHFTASAGETFVSYIEESNFTQKFMKTLKEVFTNQLTDFSPSESTFAAETKLTVGSLETATFSDATSTKNSTFKSIDFMEMLIYAHNNFISTTDNCYFLGPNNFTRLATMDPSGSYRYYNSMKCLDMINSTVGYLNDESNYSIDSLEDIYSLSSSYSEILAYRIEKIGGAPTGDLKTQNTLQNFWFFNTYDFMEGTEFYDSQVKYNTQYTYKVYAYTLKVGSKYSFSDLRLSRQIGSISGSEPPSYCLEFYDPTTEESIEQIFSSDNELTASNQAATNAQITSESRYLADFYLNYEPVLKLVEIPIFSKSLKIMDHISNQVNIYPYQMMDASQRIGYTINYETFNANLDYPSTISSNDVIIKEEYLNANDYLSSSVIYESSITKQRYIEVYKMDQMPTSIDSFDGNLLETIDLRSPGTMDTNSVVDFVRKIRANKKYYYVFRALNEQRMPGHLSEIYEAQLINDGGYLYSIFNVLFEEDLEQEIFVNPSLAFKKLFELQPNVSQMALDISEADLSMPAYTQLENINVGTITDTIWDKTFKIRLTSVKTGKKIDLNFTYKLQID
jgi:hypothetical protein